MGLLKSRTLLGGPMKLIPIDCMKIISKSPMVVDDDMLTYCNVVCSSNSFVDEVGNPKSPVEQVERLHDVKKSTYMAYRVMASRSPTQAVIHFRSPLFLY
ncbi:hypothetical protein QCA50_011864 [Cerrena zonata]|uniref:Uncharacterized protein n=1 Tax=Cerrena zonata TaxID=2478898 RepID=A0AAW0G3Q8_9APHY